MNRRATLLIVAVFLLGIALGALGMHVAASRVFGSERSGQAASKAHKDKSQIIDELTQELTLNAEQRAQLESILEASRTKYQAIYEQVRPQYEQVRAQGRDRIRAMLTAEQLPKYEAFVRRLDEERKKRNAR